MSGLPKAVRGLLRLGDKFPTGRTHLWADKNSEQPTNLPQPWSNFPYQRRSLTGTIIELLTATNPELDLRYQPTGAVTQSHTYEPLAKAHVVPWPDFTYENIKDAFGHLFEIGPLVSDAIQDLRGTPGRIRNENQVDNVGVMWNYQICRHPMKRAAEKVQHDLGVERREVTMESHGQASKGPSSDAKASSPDWCIFLWNPEEPEDDSMTVAVWGDSKCSSKWASDENRMPLKFRFNWLWPFRQVLTYCVNNATRYGYILTPEEVVVLRVYEDRATPSSPWRVQHTAVPWGNSGEGTLTVNLAIWTLAMMALNEGHRPIRTLDQTLPLNVWWMDSSPNQQDSPSYEHHLSGTKVSHAGRPRAIDARPRPSTIFGVEAASEAGEEEDTGRRRSKRVRRN